MPSLGAEAALVARLLVTAVQHPGDISVAVLVPGQTAGDESLYGVGRGSHGSRSQQGEAAFQELPFRVVLASIDGDTV